MTLTGGYIGAHSQLQLTMTANLTNTRVSDASALLQILRQLRVSSDATTHGKVSFFGVRIPYAVHTQCSAVCSVDVVTLAVAIQQQQCSSSAKAG